MPGNGNEAETQRRSSTVLPDGRQLKRIAPLPARLLKDEMVKTDSLDAVGRLVAMEADNAIKYRTCSWQKVIDSEAVTSRLS